MIVGSQRIPIGDYMVSLLDPETRLSTFKSADPFLDFYNVIVLGNRFVQQIRIRYLDLFLTEGIPIDIETQLESNLSAGLYKKLEVASPLALLAEAIAPGLDAAAYLSENTAQRTFAITIARQTYAIFIAIPIVDSMAPIESLAEELQASIRVDFQKPVPA